MTRSGERIKEAGVYCPKCGKENVDGAQFCQSCGESFGTPMPKAPAAYQGVSQPQAPQGVAPRVPSYLAWSIISIFLCWPFAIAAIVNAAKVDSLLAVGDVAGARLASGRAKTWATVATVIGAIGIVFVIIANVAMQ